MVLQPYFSLHCPPPRPAIRLPAGSGDKMLFVWQFGCIEVDGVMLADECESGVLRCKSGQV
jgi:hypothetical protein